MKISIYQFEIYIDKGKISHKTVPTHKGFINLDCDTFGEEEAEKCWHVCNWTCWTKDKPAELHSEIEYCGHGICFKPEDHVDNNWLSLSHDWLNGNSVEISDYVYAHKDEVIWI